MLASFADLVFAGEKIEVGLKKGKFDYAASTNFGSRRPEMNGVKKKEGKDHVVDTFPTWPNFPQTPYNPMYQYPPHQYHYSANISPPPLLNTPLTKSTQSTTETTRKSPTKSIPYTT